MKNRIADLLNSSSIQALKDSVIGKATKEEEVPTTITREQLDEEVNQLVNGLLDQIEEEDGKKMTALKRQRKAAAIWEKAELAYLEEKELTVVEEEEEEEAEGEETEEETPAAPEQETEGEEEEEEEPAPAPEPEEKPEIPAAPEPEKEEKPDKKPAPPSYTEIENLTKQLIEEQLNAERVSGRKKRRLRKKVIYQDCRAKAIVQLKNAGREKGTPTKTEVKTGAKASVRKTAEATKPASKKPSLSVPEKKKEPVSSDPVLVATTGGDEKPEKPMQKGKREYPEIDASKMYDATVINIKEQPDERKMEKLKDGKKYVYRTMKVELPDLMITRIVTRFDCDPFELNKFDKVTIRWTNGWREVDGVQKPSLVPVIAMKTTGNQASSGGELDQKDGTIYEFVTSKPAADGFYKLGELWEDNPNTLSHPDYSGVAWEVEPDENTKPEDINLKAFVVFLPDTVGELAAIRVQCIE